MSRFFKRILVVTVSLFCSATGYAQDTKVVVIPLFGDEASRYALGDVGPAGGTVFHVTDGGLHGFEYAPTEGWVQAPWGCLGIDVGSAENLDYNIDIEDSGTGLIPTTHILKDCLLDNQVTAAVHVLTYIWPGIDVADGFLPDLDELLLLTAYFKDYDQADPISVGYRNSADNIIFNFWSSTEYINPENSALTMNYVIFPSMFGSPLLLSEPKDSLTTYAIPIRSF